MPFVDNRDLFQRLKVGRHHRNTSIIQSLLLSNQGGRTALHRHAAPANNVVFSDLPGKIVVGFASGPSCEPRSLGIPGPMKVSP